MVVARERRVEGNGFSSVACCGEKILGVLGLLFLFIERMKKREIMVVLTTSVVGGKEKKIGLRCNWENN